MKLTLLLTQLEYFVALAHERHFGRAAAVCHISQSALSEAIQKLEVELDIRLVERGRSFTRVTPEGERLLAWARRMVADETALRDAANTLRAGLTGTLRIGVVPSATTIAARFIDRFALRYPLVRVQLETGLPSEGIAYRIRQFELDAGVMYPLSESTKDLTVTLLYREEQQVLLPAAVAAGRNTVSGADLADMRLALLPTSMRARQLLDEAMERYGHHLRPHITADSTHALIEMVRLGKSASVVPTPLASPEALPAGVAAVGLVEPDVSLPVVLVTLGFEPISLVARAAVQMVRDGLDFASEYDDR